MGADPRSISGFLKSKLQDLEWPPVHLVAQVLLVPWPTDKLGLISSAPHMLGDLEGSI